MTISDQNELLALPGRFEEELRGRLQALDPEEYPQVLRECLREVLLAGAEGARPRRGVPLLLAAAGSPEPPEMGALVAAECLLRGYLMLAELSLPPEERPAAGLVARLGQRFAEAQLLLTVDTLFTWPLELLAEDQAGADAVRRMAEALRGALDELDRAPATAGGLAEVEPVGALVRGAGAKKELSPALEEFSRWIWLLELADWLGGEGLREPITESRAHTLDLLRGCEAIDPTAPGLMLLAGVL